MFSNENIELYVKNRNPQISREFGLENIANDNKEIGKPTSTSRSESFIF